MKTYNQFQMAFHLIVGAITLYLCISSIIRIYSELAEPFIINGIEGILTPPPRTSYGGILLNNDPSYLQQTVYSCGPAALALACQILGIKTNEKELTRLAGTEKRRSSMLELAKAAKAKGLRVCGLFLTFDDLRQIKKPVIAFVSNNHFVVVHKIKKDKILITDPIWGKVLLNEKTFFKLWKGYVLALEKERKD